MGGWGVGGEAERRRGREAERQRGRRERERGVGRGPATVFQGLLIETTIKRAKAGRGKAKPQNHVQLEHTLESADSSGTQFKFYPIGGLDWWLNPLFL